MKRVLSIIALLLLLALQMRGQTIYAVVLGNQKYVVGSSTLHSGLFRSSDLGKSWEHLGPENLKGYSMDAVESSRGRILYIAAGNGVHRSTDYGKSWKIVTDWRMTEVLDVKVNQRDPRQIYAATAWGFWRSSDGGDSWENPPGLVQHEYLNRIEGNEGYLHVYGMYCFFSGSNGDRWYLLSQGTITPTTYGTKLLPAMNIYDIVDYHADIHHQWIAGDSGVFDLKIRYAPDGGNYSTSITPLTANLPIHAVHALGFVRGSNTLFAGTFGEGVYRREVDHWVPSGLEGSQIWRLIVKEY